MEKEIINKVANSQLITIDLEEYYSENPRSVIDIKPWLYQGLILKEADFRENLKAYDWEQFKQHYVALTCSSGAIIPSWAFMLMTTYLAPFAAKVVVGNLVVLETIVFNEIVADIDASSYLNLPVIIKGCTKKPIPESAYVQLVQKLLPVARSVMFGEACSTVPLYKKKKP